MDDILGLKSKLVIDGGLGVSEELSTLGTQEMIREQEAVPSVAYEKGEVLLAFGLPVSTQSQVAVCDSWEFPKVGGDEGSGVDRLSKDVIRVIIKACMTMFDQESPQPGKTSLEYRGSTLTCQLVKGVHTYDGLDNTCVCVKFIIQYTGVGVVAHAPLVFYGWYNNQVAGQRLELVAMEAARDYRAALRQANAPGLGPLYRHLIGSHTLAEPVDVSDKWYKIVPWDGVMLHDAPVADVRKCFDGSGRQPKPSEPAFANSSARLPCFVYATRQDDYIKAVKLAETRTPLRYSYFWHERGSGGSTQQFTALCMADRATDMPPVNTLWLGTNGGKSVTAACTIIRIRETGRYLYHTVRRNQTAYKTHELTNVGVNTKCYSELLAGCYSVDNFGSIVTMRANRTPWLMHTVVFSAIRNALMHTELTLAVCKDVPMVMQLVDEVFTRMKIDCDWQSDDEGMRVKWYYKLLGLKGEIILQHGIFPGIRLHGFLAEWQYADGPGSYRDETSVRPPTFYPWWPEDDTNTYTPMMYLDTGKSLLGRYMMQEHITKEYRLMLDQVLLPVHLREQGLLPEGLSAYVGPQNPGQIDVVFDIEYAQSEDDRGVKSKTPTSMGVAVFKNGRLSYLGTSVMTEALLAEAGLYKIQAVADGLELKSKYITAPQQNPSTLQHLGLYQALKRSAPMEDLWPIIKMLREFVLETKEVRLWGKGIDTDYGFLMMAEPGLSRIEDWATRRKAVSNVLLTEGQVVDMGANMRQYSELARSHGLSTQHHPGAEVLLFAYHAGLWYEKFKFEPQKQDKTTPASGAIDAIIMQLLRDKEHVQDWVTWTRDNAYTWPDMVIERMRSVSEEDGRMLVTTAEAEMIQAAAREANAKRSLEYNASHPVNVAINTGESSTMGSSIDFGAR